MFEIQYLFTVVLVIEYYICWNSSIHETDEKLL